MKFVVTESAMRPASKDRQCFYCQQPIGAHHKDDCVLVKKTVRVRMVVEYDIEVPAFWDSDLVESHRNEGSWCADNAIEELQKIQEIDGCLCHRTHFEHVSDAGGIYLEES